MIDLHTVTKQLLDKDSTELNYIERSVFEKDVTTNTKWTLEMGKSVESTPTTVGVRFPARNEIDTRTQFMQHFIDFQLLMRFVKWDQKNTVDGIECTYDRDTCYQEYCDIENSTLKLTISGQLLISKSLDQIYISSV